MKQTDAKQAQGDTAAMRSQPETTATGAAKGADIPKSFYRQLTGGVHS